MILDVSVPSPLNQRALIYLDGEQQHLCIYADDARGVVVRYVSPPQINPFVRGELLTEQVTGSVHIVDPEAVNLHDVYTRCDRG